MGRIIKTLFVVWIYGIVWIILEIILYGYPDSRIIDEIMLMLFTPIIYKAMNQPKGEKY